MKISVSKEKDQSEPGLELLNFWKNSQAEGLATNFPIKRVYLLHQILGSSLALLGQSLLGVRP